MSLPGPDNFPPNSRVGPPPKQGSSGYTWFQARGQGEKNTPSLHPGSRKTHVPSLKNPVANPSQKSQLAQLQLPSLDDGGPKVRVSAQ